MAKTARKHFLIDPWIIKENYFSKDFSMVAESVFSLGNEYMGSRGFLDEGTIAPTLVGTYLNGVYEYSLDKMATGYKGIATRTHYMVNAMNFFDLTLYINGVRLDMVQTPFESYERYLDLRTGKLIRKLTWLIGDIKLITTFERFLDMEKYHRAYQKVTFKASKECTLTINANISFNNCHFGNPSRWMLVSCLDDRISCKTSSTNQIVTCMMDTSLDDNIKIVNKSEKVLTHSYKVNLREDEVKTFKRLVNVVWNDNTNENELKEVINEGYENASKRNDRYWMEFWKKSDIEIVGDEENQQGIRFCIFQLQQTYHGASENDNIGAKGLTGEAYSGHTFWDSETYCLPYYLFNNKKAAKNLLEYRYKTLEEAKKRAYDLDCEGACYPIATLNGEEACTLWQHASLQFQPTTAVAYGIYHYVNVCKDYEFLYSHGVEMLVEISRFLVARGQWDSKNENYGYYAVMGPDEFQMMVNHNTYTNYMAKKTLYYTIDIINNMPKDKYNELIKKTNLKQEELDYFKLCADKMLILYDDKSNIFEQHDGFFKLPHIDVDKILDNEFPLYQHWSYDRIYRNDMIKQPDVLMFMLLYNSDFSLEQKKANYDYYEPKCIHESSLSPSVHSIIACELNKLKDATDFFSFATRMDLDDYNRNSCEGLHTTSISAAWLNIVYGFGGLRSDKELSINPTIPLNWEKYSFNITINNSLIKIEVSKNNVIITNLSNEIVNLLVYKKPYEITRKVIIER